MLLGEGQNSRVFQEGDRVRKVARHPAAARALQREGAFLRRWSSPLAPRVHEWGTDFLVLDYLPGQPLDPDDWSRWSCAEQDRLRQDLWDFLASLPAGWIHGDLSPDHLRIVDRRLSGVIDFGDVSPGELDFELRYLYEDMGRDFFRHFCPDPQLYRRAAYHSMLDSLHSLQRHPQERAGIELQLGWQHEDVGPLPPRLFRQAVMSDCQELCLLINRAYRSGQGWTHEAALLAGARTAVEDLETLLGQPGLHLESLWSGQGRLLGCVCWERRPQELHLGLLSVDPDCQAQGWGAALLERTRQQACRWGCSSLSLSVIAQRSELVEYYRRRGFHDSGKRLPFPTDPKVGSPRRELELMEMSLPLR